CTVESQDLVAATLSGTREERRLFSGSSDEPPAALASLSPGRVNRPVPIPLSLARITRVSAAHSSLRPAPAAEADADESGHGRQRFEAERVLILECRRPRSADS